MGVKVSFLRDAPTPGQAAVVRARWCRRPRCARPTDGRWCSSQGRSRRAARGERRSRKRRHGGSDSRASARGAVVVDAPQTLKDGEQGQGSTVLGVIDDANSCDGPRAFPKEGGLFVFRVRPRIDVLRSVTLDIPQVNFSRRMRSPRLRQNDVCGTCRRLDTPSEGHRPWPHRIAKMALRSCRLAPAQRSWFQRYEPAPV
jgi:hypothetical protein